MGKEDQLCLAFANKLASSSEFCSWLVGHTKFSRYKDDLRLLNNEQFSLRKSAYWWRHWWCEIPGEKIQSETDIFAAFETTDGLRFALHIENKITNSVFTANQGANYAIRAAHMLTDGNAGKLKCSDFDTVLISPTSFTNRFKQESDKFGRIISYDEIAKFIPEFGIENVFTRTIRR
jgi:hypothetical protein